MFIMADDRDLFDSPKLTDCHRMFLRLLTVNGCLGVDEAATHLQQLIDKHPGCTGNRGELSLHTVASDLDSELRKFDFTLRQSNSESDGKAYISLVNDGSDDVANIFKNDPASIVLRVIIAYMRANPTQPLHASTAVNDLKSQQESWLRESVEAEGSASSAAGKFKTVQSKEVWSSVVHRLIENGYLEVYGEGEHIIIGPRARAELGRVLPEFVGRKCGICGTACVLCDAQAKAENKIEHTACRNGQLQSLKLPGSDAPAAAAPKAGKGGRR